MKTGSSRVKSHLRSSQIAINWADNGSQKMFLPLIDRLDHKHPGLLDLCEMVLGDRGMEDGKLIERLWDEHEIKPIGRYSEYVEGRGAHRLN